MNTQVTSTAQRAVSRSDIRRDDLNECRRWIAAHSKSFYLASLLLPTSARSASWSLYAFCRRADDAVDNADPSKQRMQRVDALRARLDRVFDDRPDDSPIDRAFATVVQTYGIPKELPLELLAGMEMDARGLRVESREDLVLYCFRAAAVVGLMMTCVMVPREQRNASLWLRAANLGVGMQLTNIARDIGEDARMGRLYVPDEWLRDLGADRQEVLRATAPTDATRAVTDRLLRAADEHYQRADHGVEMLPRSCRIAIACSRLIYSSIGQRIRQNDSDNIRKRAYVPLWQKLFIVARVVRSTLHRRSLPSIATNEDDRQLLECIAQCNLSAGGSGGTDNHTVSM